MASCGNGTKSNAGSIHGIPTTHGWMLSIRINQNLFWHHVKCMRRDEILADDACHAMQCALMKQQIAYGMRPILAAVEFVAACDSSFSEQTFWSRRHFAWHCASYTCKLHGNSRPKLWMSTWKIRYPFIRRTSTSWWRPKTQTLETKLANRTVLCKHP